MGHKSEQQIKKAKEDAQELLNAAYKQIDNTTEGIVPLYDTIENYFFQDLNYQKLKSIIPLCMIDAGKSPESSLDKIRYEQLRSIYKDSVSNRVIHWADIQGLLAAFQDRIVAVKNYLKVIYEHLPAFCLYEDSEYEGRDRMLNDTSDMVHTAINNVFVSLCSSFDLFSKVVYECSIYDINSFSEYKRLKCRKNNILYNKKNYGFNELKAEGLLYSEPTCVRTACSFRDEFIHNGTWDYRCAIYYPYIKGDVPVEPFVVMPDVDATGNLIKSGSRNKFYANSEKINIFLPKFVKDVMELLNKTVKVLIDLLEKKTTTNNKKNATDAALLIMLQNQLISKKEMIMGNKYTDIDLLKDIDLLMPCFPKTCQIIAELCKGITLTESVGISLLYSGFDKSRPYKMLMFVLLLNKTANLRNDAKLGYRLLKEAYLMTDNIYGQLKHTKYSFVLADYLMDLEIALPNRNLTEFHKEEKNIYDSLPQKIKVYRGMCDDEKQSGHLGISWTLDKDDALKYIFYCKNNVQGDYGWLAEMEIDKNEIFAVWGAVSESKEIVINPKKCKDVRFIKKEKDKN